MADNSRQMVFWTAVSSLAAVCTFAYTAMKPADRGPAETPNAAEPAPTGRTAPAALEQPSPPRPTSSPELIASAPSDGANPLRDDAQRDGDTEPAQEALQIATSYWTAWSASDHVALSTLDQLYADQIDFFGRSRSHSYVMREKTRMAHHWPRREYIVDINSLRTSCRVDGYCEVTGLFDWRTWGRDGLLDTAGVFRFGFGVQDGRIVSEFGSRASSE